VYCNLTSKCKARLNAQCGWDGSLPQALHFSPNSSQAMNDLCPVIERILTLFPAAQGYFYNQTYKGLIGYVADHSFRIRKMDRAKSSVEKKVYTLYHDLPSRHIRLLKILPDGPNGEVCCQLVHRSLDKRPSYTALSYAWGSPSSHRKIIINGEPYTVYENLWRFLDQARKLGSRFGGWLWIDALCIHQFDHKDKERQIVLMPDIYRSAEVVMIWLGPTYGDSDTAMQVLKKPMSYWQSKNNILSVWGKPAGIAIRGICSR
jgi:hypothetical protein